MGKATYATVPCRARIVGLREGDITVVLKNKPGGGELRFPCKTALTKTLTLPASGAWAPFEISGQVVSAALNDAVMEAHWDGELIEEEDCTVVRFEMITPAGDPVAAPVDAGDGQNEFRVHI